MEVAEAVGVYVDVKVADAVGVRVGVKVAVAVNVGVEVGTGPEAMKWNASTSLAANPHVLPSKYKAV